MTVRVLCAALAALLTCGCSPPAQPQVQAPAPEAAASPQPDILPGDYRFDPNHVSVQARVMHQGFSHYTFRFDHVEGELVVAANVLASTISVQIDPTSVNTGLEAFNAEVAGMLGADATPQIAFRSTGIQRVDAQHGRVLGELTMNGQTRPVALTVTLNKSAPNMFGTQTMGFSANCVVRRSDFGIAPRSTIDDVADEVSIQIEAELRKAN